MPEQNLASLSLGHQMAEAPGDCLVSIEQRKKAHKLGIHLDIAFSCRHLDFLTQPCGHSEQQVMFGL